MKRILQLLWPLLLLLLSLLLAMPFDLFSQNAYDIIDKAENSFKGDNSRGSFTMVVTTPDFTRTVKMDSWWVGNDKALIVITAPKKEKA